MLSAHLHRLFIFYINNGRKRAPPESELRDLVPTFQKDARTNRRALQSKFKSWAKRMSVENGDLVLASSRKIIMSKEECEELVMRLHSNDHVPISIILFQIQQKYTWSKKNFGMDLYTVIKVLSAHCKKDKCWSEIEKILTNRHFPRDLSRDLPLIPMKPVNFSVPREGRPLVLELQKYNPDPIRNISSEKIRPQINMYSAGFNFTLERNALPNPTPFNRDTCERNSSFSLNPEFSLKDKEKLFTLNIPNRHLNFPPSRDFVENQESMSEIPKSKNNFFQALGLSRKNRQVDFKRSLASTCTSQNVDKSSIIGRNLRERRPSLMRSCRKIRSHTEYKRLLENAEENPYMFPTVLMDKKTKFLGGLALAPKRICSQKMLSKLKEELRNKKVTEMRSLYRRHKGLRDRNKITKKVSHIKKQESCRYLSVPRQPLLRNTNLCSDNEKKYYLNERVNYVFNANGEEVLCCKRKEKNSYEQKNCLNEGQELIQNDILQSKNDRTFAFENKGHSQRPLKTYSRFSAQEQTGCLREQQYKNNIMKPLLLSCEHSKPSQMNENNASLKFQSNSSTDFSVKNNSMENLQIGSQSLLPLLKPILVPVSSYASNVVFLPPTSSQLVVKPLNPLSEIKTQAVHNAVPKQNVSNTPIIWGYLANGRVNVLNQNANPKESSNTQPQQLPKSDVRKVDGNSAVLVQPYRLLAPKNTSSASLGSNNDAERKINSDIPLQKAFSSKNRNTEPKMQSEVNFEVKSNNSNNYVSGISCEDVDVKMQKLVKWIRRMMLNIVPATFEKEVETLRMDLTAELNFGIEAVRGIRKALDGKDVQRNRKKISK